MTAPDGALARHPLYRYGMLGVIIALVPLGVWELFAFRDEPRHHSLLLILALVLLVNHIVESFLPESQRRRVRVPQFALAFACLGYVAYAFVQRF